jgi:hypothetical protein
MWEPVGPLPASVYWRRRWLAGASAVVVVLLLAWSMANLLGGSRELSEVITTRTANSAALDDPQQTAPSPAPASRSPSPPSPSPRAAAALAAPPQPGSAVPPTLPTSSEEVQPDETVTRTIPAATPVPVPATGPVPCTNAMLRVGSEIDRPQHKVGDRPVLRLVITNAGAQPCVRDLDPARQEIVVWNSSQTAKLWSSSDCSNASSPDLRTLVPGQPVVFAVTWAGRTSTPGCAQARTVLPAGSYRVLTRLDGIISPPTLFTRAP